MAGSNTKAWDELYAKIGKAANATVKVGVLAAQGAQTQDGITMLELAAIHEFGSPAAGIPERSFIRSTFAVHAKAEFETVIGKLARGIVAEKITIHRALEVLGAWSVAQVKNSISKRLIKQDLQPETIKRKNRTARDKSDATTALVNTGRLINAISYEVDDKVGIK